MTTASSSIYTVLTTLIDRLDSDAAVKAGIIPWSCPVPAFGDLSGPRLATLGINPSNREFVDSPGTSLRGNSGDSILSVRWASIVGRKRTLVIWTSFWTCSAHTSRLILMTVGSGDWTSLSVEQNSPTTAAREPLAILTWSPLLQSANGAHYRDNNAVVYLLFRNDFGNHFAGLHGAHHCPQWQFCC